MKTLLQFLVASVLLLGGVAGMAQTDGGTAGMTLQEFMEWLTKQKVVTSDAFVGHEDIYYVELPAVEELDGSTFGNLTNVYRLVLGSEDGDGLIWIHDGILEGQWTGLREFSMYQAAGKYGRETVKMPYLEDLPYVPWGIKDAWGLTDIKLPDDANVIRERAFNHCAFLSEVTLPKCISHIQEEAFYDCPELTVLTVPAPMPPMLGNGAFCSDYVKDKRKQITVVVPAGFAEEYRNAPGWSEFKEIVEDESLVYDFDPANLPQNPDSKFKAHENGDQSLRVVSEENRTAMLVSAMYYVKGYDGGIPDFRSTAGYFVLEPDLHRNKYISEEGFAKSTDGGIYTVTEIGPYAYNGYPLSAEVCIPPTVQRIRHGAFGHQYDLRSVCTRAIEPPLVDDDSVFGDKSELALYVPQGCGEAYAEAAVWRDFGSITEDPTLGSASVITIGAEASDAPATYYGLDGRLLPDGAPAGGLCIERRADGTARLVGRR